MGSAFSLFRYNHLNRNKLRLSSLIARMVKALD
jgi:hypothetical protein